MNTQKQQIELSQSYVSDTGEINSCGFPQVPVKPSLWKRFTEAVKDFFTPDWSQEYLNF